MPWASNGELPEAIRSSLPGRAQAVWRTVANQALKGGASEESAARQAWSAVKNGWKKTEEGWVRKTTVLQALAKASKAKGWASQPRVPAGKPNGGEWTESGSSSSGARVPPWKQAPSPTKFSTDDPDGWGSENDFRTGPQGRTTAAQRRKLEAAAERKRKKDNENHNLFMRVLGAGRK